MATTPMAESQGEAWFLKAKCPVFLPQADALTLSAAEFDGYLKAKFAAFNKSAEIVDAAETHHASVDRAMTDDSFTVVTDPSTIADAREMVENLAIDSASAPASSAEQTAGDKQVNDHPFMQALLSVDADSEPPKDMENKMLTENGDIALRSTNKGLVDLFFELEVAISGPRLFQLLNSAWRLDPLATLKIVFNARSIHLGKSSRTVFYRCAGWLAEHHPLTLIINLRWLSRPVIPKKAAKKDPDLDDMVVVDATQDESDPARFDVRNGVAHGYWKDLLNILALSANNKLSVLASPRKILNIERPDKHAARLPADVVKENQHKLRDARHDAAVLAFKTNPVHRALHLAVARLFAEQLRTDLALLNSAKPKEMRKISLCAKWAPSTERFHDKHTFIVSSIAEILYPTSHFDASAISRADNDNEANRTLYLRHAREAYRMATASLRRHLEVVERELSAKTYGNIKYERVPSLAMNMHSKTFIEKDPERFEQFIDKVARGKAQISGAVLLPSVLVKAASTQPGISYDTQLSTRKRPRDMVQARLSNLGLDAKVADGQWRTLVQRIKDSGALESSIAVCDVSGSMTYPTFPDGTCPMHSAIGLSLLLAEVTKPPFGGAFITFSSTPTVQKIDLSQSLTQKYAAFARAEWDMSTDFVAVFRDLILPMAVRHKLAKGDMVKRVFVFSDMQFNAASKLSSDRWSSSYERVKADFAGAGYDVPELVFWNLAGGRAGYAGGSDSGSGDPVAPKPAAADEEGVSLVSGYSQAMLKVFLDKGLFSEEEDEEEEGEVVVSADGDDVVVEETAPKKHKKNPLSTVKKAISHKAYDMLKVVD
ncbi:hypothetical protein B0T26DRAFT_875448 [Lasiosphaeria miniovina]|uniref:DUF2828 domain-containing protein n=1 Tax=Lasiosphaeria miniovina TaxID=1954250 RepID=A0AA40DM22_9PEZI|nr:uncharacterized protein B0T26DRAFT_875448 [Lasiosphaeria miniovina]KAK0706221.1 hypothetical protein B0T26DRAFT_875448 [Lasiosphaeria miniovina]